MQLMQNNFAFHELSYFLIIRLDEISFPVILSSTIVYVNEQDNIQIAEDAQNIKESEYQSNYYIT